MEEKKLIKISQKNIKKYSEYLKLYSILLEYFKIFKFIREWEKQDIMNTSFYCIKEGIGVACIHKESFLYVQVFRFMKYNCFLLTKIWNIVFIC